MKQATAISKMCVTITTPAATNYFLYACKIGNVLCALRPNKYMGTRVLRIHALLQAVVVCAFAAFGVSSSATADTLGPVLAWGRNDYGQCTIPASANSGVSAIAGGFFHTIALKDGAVLAWGDNSNGQCTIPASANSGVSAIADGAYHTIALKDGAVLAWGYNDFGACTIPDAAQSGVTAIAGGDFHTIALKNGAVMAWGRNDYDQCTIPDAAQSGVTAIAGGYGHTIALKDTDCDVDSISDTVEIAQDPTLDRNLSGTLDSCDIAANPAIDSNQNGIPDSVDLAAANAQVAALTAQLNCGDLDGNGEVNGADVGLQLMNYGPCPQ